LQNTKKYNPSDAVLPGMKFIKQPVYRHLSTFDRAVVFAGIVAFEQLVDITRWWCLDRQPHACALFKTTNKFALIHAETIRRVNTT